jgi:hypothetical protein
MRLDRQAGCHLRVNRINVDIANVFKSLEEAPRVRIVTNRSHVAEGSGLRFRECFFKVLLK